MTYIDYRAIARNATFETKLFIDGQFVDSASGKTFDVENPATGQKLKVVSEGAKEDIDRAIASGKAAFERGSWSEMAPRERKRILLNLADLIEKNWTCRGLIPPP